MSDLELAFERLAMNFRNGTCDQDEWDDAMSDFDQALIHEHDPNIIEKCVLLDENWELPVENKLKLLKAGKSMGLSSIEFEVEYHKYMCAHLDYGDHEKDISCTKLQELMSKIEMQ